MQYYKYLSILVENLTRHVHDLTSIQQVLFTVDVPSQYASGSLVVTAPEDRAKVDKYYTPRCTIPDIA